MDCWKEDILRIISKIMNREDSAMFQDAFDWEMWGLVDYPLIIKKPMHLRLVMSNVESNVYENAYQAAADMRLIFANAMTYNDISSGIYATARAIAEDWEANWTMTPAGAKDEMGPAFLKKFPVPRPQIPRTPEEQQSDDPAVLLVEQHFEKLSVLTTAMTTLDYANDFVAYVNEAITAFHAVEVSKRRLKAAGFVQISELDAWDLQPGGKYFFARNDTTVIAFAIGKDVTPDNISYTVLGAHTDSPCLKVKPVTCITKGGALMVNTMPYGGGLWHTWFDRDLGLAGRAILKGANGALETKLFTINSPIARIPNLAIHLTSGTERESFAPNLQEHAKALLSIDPSFVNATATEAEAGIAKRIHPALLRMVADALGVQSDMIEDVEMQLIDLQPSTIGGARQEFIYSGRLDNLCSSYQSLTALIESVTQPAAESITNVKIAMLFDHEEVGSASCQGAGSSMFMDTIQRIHQRVTSSTTSESLLRALRRSFIVSADMAHGLHPNYPAKHDSSMAPLINQGLVIKHNANQRYATNAISASVFRRLAAMAKEPIPVQEFSVRSDAGCGSTIGPILATLTGVLTVDCGTPQYSMHSIREMMGSADVKTGVLHLRAVLDHHPAVAANLDSIRI